MRRVLAVGLLALVLALAATGAAVAQVDPGSTSTTTPPAETGGTSPWVLVLIGAAAGAVVGGFTGLARRRRAQQGSPNAPR